MTQLQPTEAMPWMSEAISYLHAICGSRCLFIWPQFPHLSLFLEIHLSSRAQAKHRLCAKAFSSPTSARPSPKPLCTQGQTAASPPSYHPAYAYFTVLFTLCYLHKWLISRLPLNIWPPEGGTLEFSHLPYSHCWVLGKQLRLWKEYRFQSQEDLASYLHLLLPSSVTVCKLRSVSLLRLVVLF